MIMMTTHSTTRRMTRRPAAPPTAPPTTAKLLLPTALLLAKVTAESVPTCKHTRITVKEHGDEKLEL